MRASRARFATLVAWLLAGCSLAGVPPAGRPTSPSPGPSGAPAPRNGSVPAPSPSPRPDAPRAGADPRAGVPRPAPSPRFGEVRALWVVRTTLTSPESVRGMVERAERAGFNTLLVQVRGRGDAFYSSALEPRAEPLANAPVSFDPLDLVVREAHARGLAVHAWMNTHLVWSGETLPGDMRHLVWTRPEALAVPRALAGQLLALHPDDPRYLRALLRHASQNADRVEGVFTSPSHPWVQEHNARVAREIVERYALDGIHLDYVRYASSEFDYSAGTLEAFRAWALPRVTSARAAELDRAARRDPFAWADALAGPFDEFRREAVTQGVERLAAEVRSARPGVLVSAAVFSDSEDAYRHRYQDWISWMREGRLDVVVPMAYTADDRRFRSQVQEAVARVGAGRVWAGIGAWQNTPEGTVSKIALARELGARGFSLFSYDWAAGQRWRGVPFLERVLEGG